MIRFSLCCVNEHSFEGWFRNNADFENQRQRALVACPVCSSTAVDKAIMAPAVLTPKSATAGQITNDETRDYGQSQAWLETVYDAVRDLKKHSVYVGEKFAEEARKMHYGELEPHSIYGKANNAEITSLIDDGIHVLPLPVLPEEKN